MTIPKHLINQINEQADLVGIIRRHTILKPAGKEFKGCCPFHGEKTPSFYVNPQTNLYHCFGCGVSGNAITFLVEFEKLSFIEAVKELAQKTGIDLPKEDEQKFKYPRQVAKQVRKVAQNSPHQKNHNQTAHPNTQDAPSSSFSGGNTKQLANQPLQKADLARTPQISPSAWQQAVPSDFVLPTHSLPANTLHHPPSAQAVEGDFFELLTRVTKFYQHMLSKNTVAYTYLLNRGVSKESIDTFELGYAPEPWQHLAQAFPNDIEGLRQLGLIRTSQKNGREFDLFRARIIFPIKDRQGQVVGFAGRALSDDIQPKYINSTDSVVFKKQHILYGFYESRQQRAKDWLVVEGYMDVIALYQAGIYGAVAPMGTAVNENQIANLLKFNDCLTLSFDGDKAGQKAALRALEVAMPVLGDDKTLKFLVLADGHDPDTFIKHYGEAKMQTAIEQAMSLSDFLYHIVSQNYDTRLPEHKAKIMSTVKEITAKLPKGSSLRWWLNSDMYQRLRGQKNEPLFAAQTPPKAKPITPSHQLLLSLMHSPELLYNDPITHLYAVSGLTQLDAKYQHQLSVPALPDWQDLEIDGLNELITSIRTLQPFLKKDKDEQSIDANAHMILSALDSKTLQSELGGQWRDFIHTQRQHGNIEPLFFELLVHSIIQALKKEHSQCQNLSLSQLYKKRLLTLERYDRQVIKAQAN